MKILITKPGIFRGFGEPLPVGSTVEVPDGFTGWAGKWRKVEGSDQPLEVATPKRRHKPKAEASETNADE